MAIFASIRESYYSRLLVRARPATTVVCPGCEADCVMPVQTIPTGPRGAVRFIVCDKRSDINRVALTAAHVDQWKCDAEALAAPPVRPSPECRRLRVDRCVQHLAGCRRNAEKLIHPTLKK